MVNKFQNIFLKIVKIYIKKYPEHAFEFVFDDTKHPKIGESKKVIKVRFNNSASVFQRIFTEWSLGLGESYCEGNIEIADSDYKYFLMIFVKIASEKKLLLRLHLVDIFYVIKARLKNPFHTRKDQHDNINAHYSLGDWFKNEEDANQFYLYRLDSDYIQYSCGKRDPSTKTVEQSQINKFDFYAKRLWIKGNQEDKTLLDLWCGRWWFMFYLAEKHNISCTGMTLSLAQFSYIQKEVKKRWLEKYIHVKQQNVHNMEWIYDYIASIGLLEHIDNYEHLYKTTRECLQPHGRALFHSMFQTDFFYTRDAFLSKHIFPWGSVPNIRRILKIFHKHFDHVERNDLPNMSYPKTLDCRFETFCDNEEKIRKLLREKSVCKDIEYSIRVFKHYLTLANCGLSHSGLVSNILVY